MSELEFISLPQSKGWPYLNSYLSSGNALSKLVGQSLDPTLGEFSIILPRSFLGVELNDLGEGIGFTGDEPLSFLAAELRSSIRFPETIAVFEDSLASRLDPSLIDSGLNIRTYGDEVYYLLPNDSATQGSLMNFIDRSLNALSFTAFVTRSASVGKLQISPNELVTWAGNVELIAVGALDNETFVTWKSVERQVSGC